MMSILKSVFKRAEPDIFLELDALKEIEDVADFCFIDAEGNVLRTGSGLSNSVSQFNLIGKHITRMSLLLSAFTKWAQSDSNFWQLQCAGGSILVWNFGASHLLVFLKNRGRLPVVRMTVNIFRESALEKKSLAKYFQQTNPDELDMWRNDPELQTSLDCVLGNQTKEKK